MWLKVYKTFRGGRSKDDFIEVPDDCDDEDQKEAAKDWAERTDGGHAYGWTVYWEPKTPPPEWVEKKIASLRRRSSDYITASAKSRLKANELEKSLKGGTDENL